MDELPHHEKSLHRTVCTVDLDDFVSILVSVKGHATKKNPKQIWNSFGLKSSTFSWLPTMAHRIYKGIKYLNKVLQAQ